jgi:hypothetical protein
MISGDDISLAILYITNVRELNLTYEVDYEEPTVAFLARVERLCCRPAA